MKDLIGAAIKSTYDTRSPGGVERCVDLLIRLKSMSLSVKHILYFSESIFKLETLRRHRKPRIREVSQSLFTSLLKTLYSQGTDESASLDAGRLKRKGTKIGSLTKKKARTDLLVSPSDKKQDHKTLALVRTETKTNVACKSVTKKPPCRSLQDSHKICSVTTATDLTPQSRRDIKDKDGKVTTKTLIPPPRRVAACKNVPANDSRNPKTEEMVELFEAAKKAANLANAKGILSGKADASCCVEAISLLMKINVTPKPNEPRRMIERLQGITKHKDRTICNAAIALLQLWRQRIGERERKESSATENPVRAQRTCGQGLRRESTKAMKLVM
ncbi:Transcription factor IIS family protein [Raphanus sativus]|nr:Transcription factor IIS family protein [Raphanus sativus]